jgi:lipid-binding SYLF domain-containing protein
MSEKHASAKDRIMITRKPAAPLASLVALFLVIVSGASLQARADSGAQIDSDVNAALSRFFREVGGARDLANRSAGILVFPSVVKAGMGVGGEYGEGALRRRGRTEGYYNTVSASFGFQLGVQARTVVIVFMTEEALESFRRKNGWKVGVDGSVTLVTVGVGGSVDTNQIKSPVVGFILDQKGLMYNLTLEGSKISRIDR